MKKLIWIFVLFCTVISCSLTVAAADDYIGDTAIYSTNSATSPKPNIMFIVDNTQPMQQSASRELYDPTETYIGTGSTGAEGPYEPNAVYKMVAATGGTINYSKVMDTVADITGCSTAYNSLTTNGSFFGPLKANKGDCSSSQNDSFFLGNQLNYIVTPVTGAGVWSAGAAFLPGDTIAVSGTIYECVAITGAGTTGAVAPTWPLTAGTIVIDHEVTWTMSADLLSMVQSTLKQVADAVRESVNIGLMTFSDNGKGGQLEIPIANISLAAGTANLSAFNTALDNMVLIPGNSTQPVNETLWDAGLFFKGPAAFTDVHQRLGTREPADSTYTSMVSEACQKNFVVLLTTGSQDDDTNIKSYDIDNIVAAASAAELEGIYVDDVALYLNTPDPASSTEGIGEIINGSVVNTEGVQTHIIQLMTAKVARLEKAAQYGGGKYFQITNNAELLTALQEALADILLETDTAFIAPVVPTSPDNRTFSGERVYLGFFYPENDEPWHGNLKKFAINNDGHIVDPSGQLATNADGSFRDIADTGNPSTNTYTTSSFWSSNDAGRVSEGGVGEVMLSQIGSRKIFTYLGSSDLTDSGNAFSTSNSNITATTLNVVDAAEKDKLINFIHGYDSYDEYIGANRPWILGDILHSKPNVINYSQYDFSVTSNESNCSVNKTTVFVGANDGMLHAFRDCDGQERWAFIPPELLPSLQDMRGSSHPYYVDGSPVTYIYDADRDGNVEPGDGDWAILLFGLRRGGEAYYALDVTDPDAPEYLWKISSSDADFAELGQSWSTPTLGLVKNSSGENVIAAFIGAGYDNANEDGRFGDTQGFTNSNVAAPTGDAGYITSTATVTPLRNGSNPVTNNPKGRGVYAFEVATINSSGIPVVPTSPTKIWDFVYGDPSNSYNSSRLTYSMPSKITAFDSDYDGYIDRLYVGDTGGHMWRFSYYETTNNRPQPSPVINNWTGRRIFSANGGGDLSTGRKIFYRPSITQQIGGITNLYFGTGDRAHPLNMNVIDRMYSIFDRHQRTVEDIDEDDIIDVTDDLLQDNSTSSTQIDNLLADLDPGSLMVTGTEPGNFGWMIKLDETGHEGEKVLAAALAFNKVAYYTTYAPGTLSSDPCLPGNLGTSRLYAVDYLTGEAVLNFDNASNTGSANNDGESTSGNDRAEDGNGNVLRRSDRSVDLGVGIPSGIVVLLPPSGDAKLLIGCGGGLCQEDPVPGGTIYPIYWRSF